MGIAGSQKRIITFLKDYAVVGRIITHLKLTFVADKPPPPLVAYHLIFRKRPGI
jgi:hypothetical protein